MLKGLYTASETLFWLPWGAALWAPSLERLSVRRNCWRLSATQEDGKTDLRVFCGSPYVIITEYDAKPYSRYKGHRFLRETLRLRIWGLRALVVSELYLTSGFGVSRMHSMRCVFFCEPSIHSEPKTEPPKP